MSRDRAHNPAARWFTCEQCNHRGYLTRGDAKAVKKNHHGEKGMTVYSCPYNDGMFHVGHRPEALTAGVIDRRQLRLQALEVAGGNAAHSPERFGDYQNGSTATRLKDRPMSNPKVVPIISGGESGYAERVEAAVSTMLDRRMEAARDEYELRCLPAGSRVKVPVVDQHGQPVDLTLVGRTGTVLDVQPWPVTTRDGDLLEVMHTVRFDDAAEPHSLADTRMTVSAASTWH